MAEEKRQFSLWFVVAWLFIVGGNSALAAAGTERLEWCFGHRVICELCILGMMGVLVREKCGWAMVLSALIFDLSRFLPTVYVIYNSAVLGGSNGCFVGLWLAKAVVWFIISMCMMLYVLRAPVRLTFGIEKAQQITVYSILAVVIALMAWVLQV